MNEYIHFKYISSGGEKNTSMFINIKRKLPKDKISMTALLRPEVFGNGWHNSSPTVKLKPVANMRTDSITNKWLSQARPGQARSSPSPGWWVRKLHWLFRSPQNHSPWETRKSGAFLWYLLPQRKHLKVEGWLLTVVEGAINWEELRIPGQTEKENRRTDLSRVRVTLKWPLERKPGRVCKVDGCGYLDSEHKTELSN